MSSDSKDAEKRYLQRSGSIAWERFKPFSPPGTDTIRDSVQLMHDFAVAVAALDPQPGHRVLDLGMGSGWTSDWLRRLNRRVVSLDIATDMLTVARERSTLPDPALVAGDFEALPFADRAFDRALCLNALHHVPNPALALREIARVLRDDGTLVLIEPGAGHAVNPTSQAAMSDFGVLEQDLEAAMLMRLCGEAGFARVTVRPLSYMSGELELTLGELTRWRQWSRAKRPIRAARKIGRALLEMAGRRKDGLLLEDALAMTASRILMRHLSEQSLIVAHKSGRAPVPRQYRAAIAIDRGTPLEWRDGAIACTVRVSNVGNVTWIAGDATGAVQVGAQLLDERKRLIDRDAARARLPADVRPGEQAIVRLEIPAPAGSGARYLKFDLVAEGVAWFEQEGSTALVVPLEGQPS